jgi:hypothetical protein
MKYEIIPTKNFQENRKHVILTTQKLDGKHSPCVRSLSGELTFEQLTERLAMIHIKKFKNDLEYTVRDKEIKYSLKFAHNFPARKHFGVTLTLIDNFSSSASRIESIIENSKLQAQTDELEFLREQLIKKFGRDNANGLVNMLYNKSYRETGNNTDFVIKEIKKRLMF